MANSQQVNIGTTANDGTGDPLRTAFTKYNGHLHPAADVSDSTAAGRTLLTAASATAQRTALNVADGATANSTDAQLRDRATHTGEQAISTVTGLQTALDAKAATAGPTFTLTTKFAGLKGTAAGISSNYSVVNTDTGKMLVVTSAVTITFPAVATLCPNGGDFFSLDIHNDSAGSVILDCTTGATNVTMDPGELATIYARNSGKMIVAKGPAVVIS